MIVLRTKDKHLIKRIIKIAERRNDMDLEITIYSDNMALLAALLSKYKLEKIKIK
uniref:Uncharacterized protein n=1 Tax=Sulfolobus tengchongensis TaxID=207809 RepID=Q6H0Y0_9CREN|nr:hypothetical protein [Sulfolobus tengchongensis]